MIKQIEVVFENCETLTFPAASIEDFYISEIRERCNQNGIYKAIFDFILTVRTDAKVESGLQDGPDEAFPCSRFRHNDVTWLNLTYEDDSTNDLHVVWPDDDIYGSRTATAAQYHTHYPEQNLFVAVQTSQDKDHGEYLDHYQKMFGTGETL